MFDALLRTMALGWKMVQEVSSYTDLLLLLENICH